MTARRPVAQRRRLSARPAAVSGGVAGPAAVAHVPFPGGHSFHFVSDPDLVRRVLVDDHASFVKGRALRARRRLLGDGLLTSEGTDHLRRRRMIQPVFPAPCSRPTATRWSPPPSARPARWRDGAEIDINGAMTDLALDIVGRTIFNADVESEASEIRDVLDAGMRVFHRFLLPGGELLWRLPLPATRALQRPPATISTDDPRPDPSRQGAAQDGPT